MSRLIYADQQAFEKWLLSLNELEITLATLGTEYLLSHAPSASSLGKWVKPVSTQVWQLRIGPTIGHLLKFFDFEYSDAVNTQKILLRVFYVPLKSDDILLLSGYDKRVDPSRERQKIEIKNAEQMFELWTQRSEVF